VVYAVHQHEPTHPGGAERLAEQECWELLAGHEVGRVAYCDDRGPVVLPVNYSLDRQTILIRLAPYSRLAVHLEDALASFQIDEYDSYNQPGGACSCVARLHTSIPRPSLLKGIGRSPGPRASAASSSESSQTRAQAVG
jgi:hypothetical protein